MERKREGQTHFGMRPKQSEAEKRKQKSVSEGVRRGKRDGATFRCGDFDFEIQIPINFPTIWHTMRESGRGRKSETMRATQMLFGFGNPVRAFA